MSFKKNLIDLQSSVLSAIKNNIDLNKKPDDEKAVYDYDEKQKIYYFNNLMSNLKITKEASLGLSQLTKFDIKNKPHVSQILGLMPELETKDLQKIDNSIKKMAEIVEQINFPETDQEEQFKVPQSIPAEIEPDIRLDIKELNKCFNNECYRSAVILCGRILEIALHRKHFEVTAQDLLQKAPGMGLGKLIAKLNERNVNLDPAVTNQIHLINQVRVSSVHIKKEAFVPTKEQTHAIILYSLDILEKLFV